VSISSVVRFRIHRSSPSMDAPSALRRSLRPQSRHFSGEPFRALPARYRSQSCSTISIRFFARRDSKLWSFTLWQGTRR
jgi:hypothetical protein